MRISDWSSDVCSSDLLSVLPARLWGNSNRRRHPMGEMNDKVKAAGNKAAGAIKEANGRNQRDPDLVAEGRAQKAKGTGQDIKRSEEHTYEIQSLLRIAYAVFCLNKNTP